MIKPEDLRDKRILISPLNWGMGHVARSIGMIHQLLNQGNDIFIACDQEQEDIFREYFQKVSFILHAGYPFYFGGKGNFAWDLLSRSRSLRSRMKSEREEVKQIVIDKSIDIVISDHRYGFISTKIPSIFMTHQVNLPVKWYEKGVGLLHRKLMKQFTYVWVLDDDKSSLAGKLSANCPKNGYYIGPYSRFSVYTDYMEKEINHVLVASGPKVYAEQLIQHILKRQATVPGLTIVHSTSVRLPEGIEEVSGSWKEKDAVIRSARFILSRSGYSTLMDCVILDSHGIFIPTEGQAEQEYLAERWLRRK